MPCRWHKPEPLETLEGKPRLRHSEDFTKSKIWTWPWIVASIQIKRMERMFQGRETKWSKSWGERAYDMFAGAEHKERILEDFWHFQRLKWGWGETVGYYTLIMRSVCLTFQLIKNAHAVTWGSRSVFFVCRKSVEEKCVHRVSSMDFAKGSSRAVPRMGAESPQEDSQPGLVCGVRKGYQGSLPRGGTGELCLEGWARLHWAVKRKKGILGRANSMS